jgi:hypothetical protein
MRGWDNRPLSELRWGPCEVLPAYGRPRPGSAGPARAARRRSPHAAPCAADRKLTRIPNPYPEIDPPHQAPSIGIGKPRLAGSTGTPGKTI